MPFIRITPVLTEIFHIDDIKVGLCELMQFETYKPKADTPREINGPLLDHNDA
jgi:hypothetical protein